MRRILRTGLVLTVLISTFSPVEAVAVSANPSPVCSGATCKVTFPFTGESYAWTVPYSGSYQVQLWGAAGGSVTSLYPISGGFGGYLSGFKDFTSGQVLNIYVGGKGSDREGNHP